MAPSDRFWHGRKTGNVDQKAASVVVPFAAIGHGQKEPCGAGGCHESLPNGTCTEPITDEEHLSQMRDSG